MIRTTAALAAAIAIAVTVTAMLVMEQIPPQRTGPISPTGPLVPSPTGSVDEALRRGLFGPPGGMAAADLGGRADLNTADTADMPTVVGIVGRLPDQAVVLVRRTSGGTRTIAIGDSVEGWRLDSIAADAVMFVQGDRRERVQVNEGAIAAAVK